MTKSAVLGSPWPAVFPEAWASDWGEDAVGLWMAFTYRGVRYAFRWIKPGSFLMGSPRSEPERFDDETQHQVTLTHGFWLGETTVTQALWQVVMGTNPSHFRGDELPVERVSWHDAKEFMQALNRQKSHLNLQLPTEAQWEYACRANTRGRFHFGETITADEVNYWASSPPQGSPKGVPRETTIPVRALPVNAWGLYQMHGNVWEWCRDWYKPYLGEVQVNPEGPSEGAIRVVRGGSWLRSGGSCRSAFRDGGKPGNRDDHLGFRLARGFR